MMNSLTSVREQLVSKAQGGFGSHADRTPPSKASHWSRQSITEISEFQMPLKDAPFQVLVHLVDLVTVLFDALL